MTAIAATRWYPVPSHPQEEFISSPPSNVAWPRRNVRVSDQCYSQVEALIADSRPSRALLPKPQGLVTFQTFDSPTASALSEDDVKQNVFLAKDRHVTEGRNKP